MTEYQNHAVAYADGWADGAEAMRAACIAAVEQVDGSQAVLVFREHVLAALRVVEP